MSETSSFLRDLDEAVSRGTPESRMRALWHTTDLMIAGRYTDEEISTFGEVIGRLADQIEVTARAQLAKRLAPLDQAPVNVIHQLAFDDSIEVAGPILRQSERIGPEALLENAKTKGQEHLLAISERKVLDEAVTDVLVTRGNWDVLNSVANNRGARFSDFGFLHMVRRAEGDSIFAEQLGLREDIPRRLFQQLIAKATDEVRERLERERPGMVDQIHDTVADLAGELQSKLGPASRGHFVAKRLLRKQHQEGNLNESSIAGYAQAHRLDEVTIGLSLLSSLTADVVERALFDWNRELVLILARALNFSWTTTLSLLFLGAKDHRITARDLSDLENDFNRLNVETCRSVLEVYRSRKGGDSARSDAPAQPRYAVKQ